MDKEKLKEKMNFDDEILKIIKDIEKEIQNKLLLVNITDLFIQCGYKYGDAYIFISSNNLDLDTKDILGMCEKDIKNYNEKLYNKLFNNKQDIINYFYEVACKIVEDGNYINKEIQIYQKEINKLEFKDQLEIEVSDFKYGKKITFKALNDIVFKTTLYNYNNKIHIADLLKNRINNKLIQILRLNFKKLDLDVQKRVINYFLTNKKIEKMERNFVVKRFLEMNLEEDIKNFILSEYMIYKMGE